MPLLNDPLEALHHVRGGKPAAFLCPLDACVHPNGLNFSRAGWHHFSATLEEYRDRSCVSYEGSILEAYFQAFQPANALEAIVGFDGGPGFLQNLDSHLFYLFPWMGRSVEEVDEWVRDWYRLDSLEHGCPGIQLDEHGLYTHGPVDPLLAHMEFRRLTTVYDSLSTYGYDRRFGYVFVIVLRRGDEVRYVQRGGLHRTAAMRALGHDAIPTMFAYPYVFDVADVEFWPQVRRGTWDPESARRYVDHLFDFDARGWATDRGLVRDRPSRAPDRVNPRAEPTEPIRPPQAAPGVESPAGVPRAPDT